MSARSDLNYPNPFTQVDINFSSSGDNVIVSGAGNSRVRVFRFKILVGAATTIQIKDGAGTVLDGPFVFSANQGMILDFTSIDMPPWYSTSPGNSFIINSSNAVQVGGSMDYLQSAAP